MMQMQRYFDDNQELTAWASEVVAKITSTDLAAHLTRAETLTARPRNSSRNSTPDKIPSKDS